MDFDDHPSKPDWAGLHRDLDGPDVHLRLHAARNLLELARPSDPYTNDILGNRTSKAAGGFSFPLNYSWDCLNRMTASSPAIGATNYAYRADGMRVEKAFTSGEELAEGGSGPVGDRDTLYRYDGQMPIETYVLRDDSTTNLVQNGLGARGIDMVTYSHYNGTSTSTSVSFPLYDAHGNEVGTLARGSGTTYTVGNLRSYDAWGGVRTGSATGGPRARYCASLGHVQDDETGLVYMRGRYYEASSGRFVSQDRAMQGWSWFSYCANDPVGNIDESGRSFTEAAQWLKSLLKDYGDLGKLVFATILAGGGVTVGYLVKMMSATGKALVKDGVKWYGIGESMLGEAEGMDEAGGGAAIVACKYMSKGISEIALGYMLQIAAYMLPLLFANEVAS